MFAELHVAYNVFVATETTMIVMSNRFPAPQRLPMPAVQTSVTTQNASEKFRAVMHRRVMDHACAFPC